MSPQKPLSERLISGLWFLVFIALISGCKTFRNSELDGSLNSLDIGKPNSCRNTFYAQGCINGDTSSKCKGICSATNACITAEGDTSFLGKIEKSYPQQFACPRYMMFSPEMLLASGGQNSQFNFAVAGHDPDTDKLDKGVSSTCCHCYQLRYKGLWRGDHEPAADPGDIPLPKDLIVQSFNTQAGGPKAFDIYMGAGGFGAHNACDLDPNFFNGNGRSTSQAAISKGKFLYKNYPKFTDYFKGGVRAANLPACSSPNNQILKSKIDSAECQNAIRKQCEIIQGHSSKSTTDTVKSCIEASKVNSFYHENWSVEVRKVKCPKQLTQVTGCQPVEDSSLPSHTSSGGNFESGYHTTTMQDCCMPTCAWKENVKLQTKPGYNSFYSCNQKGEPILEDHNGDQSTSEEEESSSPPQTGDQSQVQVDPSIEHNDSGGDTGTHGDGSSQGSASCPEQVASRIRELGGWQSWMQGQAYFMPCAPTSGSSGSGSGSDSCTSQTKARINELGGWKDWMEGQAYFMPCKGKI